MGKEFFFLFFFFSQRKQNTKLKLKPPLEMPLKCDQAYGAKSRDLLKLDVLIASLNM